MRWDRLFDDLESQLEHELDAEETDLVAEEERLRLARLSLRDRVLAMAEPEHADREPLVIEVVTGAVWTLRASALGRDWIAGDLVGDVGPRRSAVIPLAAIAAVRPSAAQLALGLAAEPAAPPTASLSARLGLAFVARDLCRRRVLVELVTPAGSFFGTLDRVARDHLDLAEHEPTDPRRSSAVRGVRLVPFGQLAAIRY
ncbi:hypothetical protein [uncultured Schumannella sp.]|jgi:hypothetical protein|uniref:hypothetical protein n=1 Tax=uncultured Schumannella sp. TaxID=1195956 RepID=UPI0025F4F413|nr:hypothetical protein [uncultured Schumannella sp.]